MPRLHLIYDGKYINESCGLITLNDNDCVKSNLTFGDDALNGNVNLKYDKTKGTLTMRLDLTWNTHLMNYYKNQVVVVKCILYQKYPKIIPTKTILFDGILNKKNNIISWTSKQFPLAQLYSDICWKVRLAIPATKDFKYIPTLQEIRQEIAKLSAEEIEKERKQFNEYLRSGDPWIICESLEEKIGTYLMQKKKRKQKTNDKILIKKFTNDINNDFTDF